MHRVTSFNFRTGDVLLELKDIMRAGGAPILNPHLLGWCTATSPIDPHLADDTIATTKWVQEQWCAAYNTAAAGALVSRFDGRGGDVWLNDADITFACTQAGAQPRSNTPPSGDASNRIATTMFVDDGLTELSAYVDQALNGLPTNAELALPSRRSTRRNSPASPPRPPPTPAPRPGSSPPAPSSRPPPPPPPVSPASTPAPAPSS